MHKTFTTMKTKLCFLLSLIYFIFGCARKTENNQDPSKELTGVISISGAFALYPMTVRWAEEFQKLHPEVRIDISAGGAGKGIADVLSGMVDLAMFSRGVTPEEEARGAWKIAVVKDAVLPTVNAENPAINMLKQIGLTKEQFECIYIENSLTSWDKCVNKDLGNMHINRYTRSDACGAAEMWGKYLENNQEGLNGVGVFGDPGMADAVKNDKLGLGFNNVIYVYDIQTRKKYQGIDVIPIDINSNGRIDEDENFYDNLDDLMNAIKLGKYPSPPARDLYLISKGKPNNKLILEFLKFVLTDGQKYVNEAGYVQFDEAKRNAELQKLTE